MKLVNPGTGEISDRLTILALKILAGQDAGRDVDHFESERSLLLTKIHARTLNAAWFDALLELGAVNALIWHGEDDLRDWRRAGGGGGGSGSLGSGSVYTAAENDAIRILAFRLQDWNDRRAALVQAINREAGDVVSQEKVLADERSR